MRNHMSGSQFVVDMHRSVFLLCAYHSMIFSIIQISLITQLVTIYCEIPHIDINECTLGISGCNQNCINTIGSYVCSCYLGYQIISDNRTCMGK